MKILAIVHLYPPNHCAGAEMMLHEILLGMIARGHEVHVICNDNPVDNYEGVPITVMDRHSNALWRINWADVVITHLDQTTLVTRAVGRRKPIVHLIHNDKQLKFHRVEGRYAQLVVANSEWIKDAIDWQDSPVVVCPPPVKPERYRTTRGEHITLLNMSEAKGGDIFWQLAKRMPEHKFMAVMGAYHEQIVPNTVPKNVTVVQHTPNVTEDVYARTRVLLCPSSYESWGRVGIEAAASGIPTIAHPTPGLLESLGDSGTFVDRDDIEGWVKAIKRFDQQSHYDEMSAKALQRSAELDPEPYLDMLHKQLTALHLDDVQRITGARSFNLFEM